MFFTCMCGFFPQSKNMNHRFIGVSLVGMWIWVSVWPCKRIAPSPGRVQGVLQLYPTVARTGHPMMLQGIKQVNKMDGWRLRPPPTIQKPTLKVYWWTVLGCVTVWKPAQAKPRLHLRAKIGSSSPDPKSDLRLGDKFVFIPFLKSRIYIELFLLVGFVIGLFFEG